MAGRPPLPSRDVTVSENGMKWERIVSLEAEKDFRSWMPSCSLTDEELCYYDGITDLVTSLKIHIDSSGMSIALAHPLEKARKELHTHRANWLKWEALYRILQEVLLKLGTDPILQDRKILETLEHQLLVGELKRMLVLHSPLQNVLGLEKQHLTMFLLPHQDLEQLQKCISEELEKFLNATCSTLLNFYHPKIDNISTTAKKFIISLLPDTLTSKKHCLKETRAQHEELIVHLDQQKMAYPKVLLRCLGILKHLTRELRLGVQSDLNHMTVEYLEIKCGALLLKICQEELTLLLETYTPEKVKVHQMIRDKLEVGLSQEEQVLASSCMILSNFEVLGGDFEELVKEYARLQEMIQNHRWMLTKFDKV